MATTETPMETLRRLGVAPGEWTRHPGRSFEIEGRPHWEINTKWMNSTALRDVAFLITEGWAVSVRAGAQRTIIVRITR
ncbi:hypothetical protein [Microbacterium soli]|uniref:Uncharacterized protein n=1 Tax=Microbacterium soli TaxID=446075 RepID=A0ABP7NDF2_9MICO